MDLVLHLGAHKTASTYLQRKLAANEDVLTKNGITFVPPQEYRPAMLATAPSVPFLSKSQTLRRRRRRQVLSGMLAKAQARGHRMFVLSEENLIGNPDRLVRGTWFYDNAHSELRALARTVDQRPVRALLAIRNYADFYPSAYAEVLKLKGFLPFDAARRRRIVNQTRGWPELIEDIGKALPEGSELHIWQHEAMKTHETRILEQFIGEAATDLDPLPDRPQQGASARAVAHLHHISSRGAKVGRDRVRKVLHDNPKIRGHAAFDPWSAEERAHLTDRYRQDLERITAKWPGTLIHPAMSGPA